jgi:hypothetical protein
MDIGIFLTEGNNKMAAKTASPSPQFAVVFGRAHNPRQGTQNGLSHGEKMWNVDGIGGGGVDWRKLLTCEEREQKTPRANP